MDPARYECELCNYLELWQNDYTKWLEKCAGCTRPLREGWLKATSKKENNHGMAANSLG